MTLNDSYKQYSDGGMSKLTAPEATFEYVLERLERMKYPILDYYRVEKRSSGIPVSIFAVNDNFRRFITTTSNTTGKGHTTAQAMASGIMEMVERYSCYKYIAFRNYNIAAISNFSELSDDIFNMEEFLSILTEFPDDRMLTEINHASIVFYRGSTLDGRPAYLPLNLLTYFGTSNGMAAGNSLEEALVHGFCEVIERHCLTVIRMRKFETPAIDPDSITNAIAIDLIQRLQIDNNTLVIRDFSIGLGLPVIGVIRTIDEDNCLVTAGVATHRDEALVRALTESSQADNKIYYENMLSSSNYFTGNNIIPIESIPCIDDRNYKTELERIKQLLDRQGMVPLYVDTTDDELQIPSAITVIAKAKMDTKTRISAGAHFACALIEESLFIEGNDAVINFVNIGRSYNGSKEIFIYYEAIYHMLRRDFAQAIESFMQFNNTMVNLGNYFNQRILALSTLCLHMTGAEKGVEAACKQLISWDSNSVFNWHEGYFQILSKEVRLFRIHMLFLYLKRIRRLYDKKDLQKMQEAIGDLIKLNLYCGLLFNDKYLEALVLMTIEDYKLAKESLFDAKKLYPKEHLYDELIMRCDDKVKC